MSNARKYWQRECSKQALGLHHPRTSDFVVSCWQKCSSPLPLLIIRSIQASLLIGLFFWSFFMTIDQSRWLIYMTHWGVLLITFQAIVAAVVSAIAYFNGIPEDDSPLTWYVKLHWVMYNMSIPIAFMITIFYWSLLYDSVSESEFAPNVALDVSVHALNSCAALVALACSRVPSRPLHAYQPVGLGLLYCLFSVFYYFAGGTDPFDRPYVYAVVDWSNPGPTMVVVLLTALLIVAMHGVTVAMAILRDSLACTFVNRRPTSRSEVADTGHDNKGFENPSAVTLP